jgi:hypothetical protein
MTAVRFGWLVVGRKRVCTEQARSPTALVVEAVVGENQIVFDVCYWEAYLEADQVDFHTMIVLAALEVVLKSMIAEACLAY